MNVLILNFITGSMFGAVEFLGVNVGFWIAMGISALITVIQNVWFWTRKKYVIPEKKLEELQELNDISDDED